MVINEGDSWLRRDDNILAPDSLAKLSAVLEREPVILEHRLYRRSSAPIRLIFDDYEELEGYLKSQAYPGDHFFFWGFSLLCQSDNAIHSGKYPDLQGRTPKGGAY
jgi:hypothetical protein